MIVSLGPDGVMSADDLFYQFDGGITVSTLTSLRGAAVTLNQAPAALPAP